MKYSIWGLSVEIIGKRPYMDKLSENLSLYNKTDKKTELTINFICKNDFNDKQYLHNSPDNIQFDEESLLIESTNYLIEFSFESEPIINFAIKENKQDSSFWYLKDTRDYESIFDKIGQIFHELIIIPAIMIYFSDRLSPIHSTTIYNNKKELGLMIAGTGGVGKTTMENIFLNDKEYDFIADDFTIIDDSGFGYSNYNYPKIYGYNVLNNPALDIKVNNYIKGISKILWNYRKSKVPAYIRRRISPKFITNKSLKEKIRINKLFYLIRGHYKEPVFMDIAAEELSSIFINILKNEYHNALFRYLYWFDIPFIYGNKQKRLSDKVFHDLESVNIPFVNHCDIVKIVFIPNNYPLINIVQKLKEYE